LIQWDAQSNSDLTVTEPKSREAKEKVRRIAINGKSSGNPPSQR
jgi:hypothetical protein